MIRTIKEFEQCLQRIEIRNPPFPISIYIRELVGIARLHIDTVVNDRDDGRPTEVHFNFKLEPMYEEQFIEYVESCLRGVFLHELAETFHLDGVRVHEPHPDGTSRLQMTDLYRPSRLVDHT